MDNSLSLPPYSSEFHLLLFFFFLRKGNVVQYTKFLLNAFLRGEMSNKLRFEKSESFFIRSVASPNWQKSMFVASFNPWIRNFVFSNHSSHVEHLPPPTPNK